MNAALDYLRDTGFDVQDEDLERLSPLTSHHINFVGKYHFSLQDEVKRGELRPFYSNTVGAVVAPTRISLLLAIRLSLLP